MESHYCSKDSNIRYLHTKLSIKKMYLQFQSFYFEFVNSLADNDGKKQKSIPKEKIYRNVFSTKFNLSFFIPRKDQSMACSRYHTASTHEKAVLEADDAKHLRQKDHEQKRESIR